MSPVSSHSRHVVPLIRQISFIIFQLPPANTIEQSFLSMCKRVLYLILQLHSVTSHLQLITCI